MLDDCLFIRWIEVLAMPAVALLGIVVARDKSSLALRRYGAANKTRMEEQFREGAALLDHRDSRYSGRTAGAAILADLALESPVEYDERVMRVFQAFLDFPPRYGENHRKQGQVDYTSHDTVTILDAIGKRKPRERRNYKIRLAERRPFRVTAEGDVEQNPDYDDPTLRTPAP